MPTRNIAPVGAPCWIDLMTSDTECIRGFYGRLFGWTAQEPSREFGGYFMFTADGAPVAGCMPSQPGARQPDVWSVYLATDDAAKSIESATAHGGRVVAEAMAIADLGTMAVITDAGGAAVGLWQPGTFQGFGVLGEPGTPSWFELQARDYQAAVGFYREVLGWDTHTVSDTPELRYTTLRRGQEWLAGIMDASAVLPDKLPAHWGVYFGVEDTDVALSQVTALGGSVRRPAEDTPYGRLATAADPLGAEFKLVAPNAAMPARGSG